jgi:hypothetical protein
MILATLKAGIISAIPNFISDLVQVLTTPEKKPDLYRYSSSDTEAMILMWKAWEEDKSLYKNQQEFASAINARFGTSKSKSAILSHLKKHLQ